MGREELEEKTRKEAAKDMTTFFDPSKVAGLPERYVEDVRLMLERWAAVESRNRELGTYFDMKTGLKDLGISIPPQLTKTNCVVGWCEKAVEARVVRSRFDGYVSRGGKIGMLDDLVRTNNLRALFDQAMEGALVHGLSAMTVMRGRPGQPAAKVRAYSANQFACLWDRAEDRIKCGIVLHDVDEDGNPTAFVAHFSDAVATIRRNADKTTWTAEVEPNPMGRPLMELLIHRPTLDQPLGRTLLTRELRGIVDKAMRDVLRMEIGAEFFTFPQRYLLGVEDDLFAAPLDPDAPVDEDGDPVDEDGDKIPRVSSEAEKVRSYIGAYLALTRDENGDVPQVGQFSPAPAENFTRVFENDAQRFSGATNVPLAQLGVLSNTYTSSDALGAANDPLILAVERMQGFFREPMATVGKMMLAVAHGTGMEGLSPEEADVEAYFCDPSMPTIAARADAWTKLGAADKSIVGTRVYYEGVGLSQQTIDRLEREKESASTTQAMASIAQALATQQPQRADAPPPDEGREDAPEDAEEAADGR